MLNKKEFTILIAVVIILGFAISLIRTWQIFLYTCLAVFLVVLVNIVAKKIMSFYVDSEIQIRLWEVKRYGFKPHKYFKRPFPAGAFLPIITSALTFGIIPWMACLVFDVKAKKYRAAKRFGFFSFTEMTEYHIGLIAVVGILANLFFAVIGYLINFPEFARLNIYYAFFNMLPLSDLDGNKIFFGSLIWWTFLAVLVLIAVGYSFLLI